jgi:cell division protein ZapA
MSQDGIVTIKILDRPYKVKCNTQDAIKLQEAADYIDKQMRKLRQSSPTTSPDGIAVVTALNIYHELIEIKNQKNQCIDAMNQRINDLSRRIEEKLAEKEQIVV